MTNRLIIQMDTTDADRKLLALEQNYKNALLSVGANTRIVNTQIRERTDLEVKLQAKLREKAVAQQTQNTSALKKINAEANAIKSLISVQIISIRQSKESGRAIQTNVANIREKIRATEDEQRAIQDNIRLRQKQERYAEAEVKAIQDNIRQSQERYAEAEVKAMQKAMQDNIKLRQKQERHAEAEVKAIQDNIRLRQKQERYAEAEVKAMQRASTVHTRVTQRAVAENTRARESIVRKIRQYESLVIGLYSLKTAYDHTLGRGHEFNKLIENETIGMKLLISQQLAHTDLLGKATTSQERYNFAQKEAAKAIDIVKQVNVETPHSFKETMQIFKLLIPQVMKYGGSLEDVGETTKRMSVIAASMGIEFQQFLKTVDSAMSGQMLESGLKRALEQFGVTNEGIRELKKTGGDVVGYVLQGMEQASAAGIDIMSSWAGITAQLSNELDDLFGKMQKPIFESLKNELKDVTLFIKNNKQEILETSSYLVDFGRVALTAFASHKILKLLNGRMRAYRLLTIRATRSSRTLGIQVSRTSIALGRMGTALRGIKATMLTFAPLAVLTVAFEAWNWHTEQTEKRLGNIKLLTKMTIKEMALLDKEKKNTLVGDTKKELYAVNAVIDEQLRKLRFIDKGAMSLWDRTFSNKEDLILIAEKELKIAQKRKKELSSTLDEVQKMTPVIKALYEAEQTLGEMKKKTREEISKTNIILSNSKDKEVIANAKIKLGVLKDEEKSIVEATKQTALLLAENGELSISYNGIVEKTEAMSVNLEKAFKLTDAVARLEVQMGNKKQGVYEEEKYIKQVNIANHIVDIEARKAKLVELSIVEEKRLSNIKKTSADLEISYLSAVGKKEEVFRLKKERINKEEISDSDKIKKIEILRLSMLDKSVSKTSKKEKIIKKEVDSLQKLHDIEMLRARIGGKSEYELDNVRLSQLEKEIAAEKDLLKIEELRLEKQEIMNARQIDYLGILKDIGSEVMSGARDGKSTNQTLNEMDLGVKATQSMQQSGNPYLMATGYALEAIGALFSSSVSQAEIDKASGRVDFKDESLVKMGDLFEDVMNPQVKATFEQTKLLKQINNNFSTIAMSISGSGTNLDLTGTNYIDRKSYKSLGFGSKSKSLVGAGLDLGGTLGDVDASGYISELIKKSSWWGIIKTEKLKTKDIALPTKTQQAINDVLSDGLASILKSSVTLGFDSSEMEEALSSYEIKIGKINLKGLSPEETEKRISNAFSEIFSGAISGLDGVDNLVKKYIKTGEDAMLALSRLSTVYAQSSYQFGLIGREFEDRRKRSASFGLFSYKSKEEQILDIDKFSGGKLSENLGGFMESFYSDAEKFEFATTAMEESFSNLGQSLPKTGEEYRKLIETFNITNEEQEKTFAGLLALSPQFAQLLETEEGLSGETSNLNGKMKELQSTLENTYVSLGNTIDKLRGASTGSEYSLTKYHDSMQKSKDLLKSGNIEDFQKEVAKTQNLSSILYNESAFGGIKRDMEFSQLVAANQFETMQVDIQAELDIMRDQTGLLREIRDTLNDSKDVQSASYNTQNKRIA